MRMASRFSVCPSSDPKRCFRRSPTRKGGHATLLCQRAVEEQRLLGVMEPLLAGGQQLWKIGILLSVDYHLQKIRKLLPVEYYLQQIGTHVSTGKLHWLDRWWQGQVRRPVFASLCKPLCTSKELERVRQATS